MTIYTAVLDACVLVPVPLADTLQRLAEIGLYRPVWNEPILEETARALERINSEMKKNGSARKQISTMNSEFPGACVEEWEHLVDSIDLPDPDDRHVVAAGIKGRADAIVTHNLKDFPSAVLEGFNLTPQSPDDFLLNQLGLYPELVSEVVKEQAADAKNPPLFPLDVLGSLKRAGAPAFAASAKELILRSR